MQVTIAALAKGMDRVPVLRLARVASYNMARACIRQDRHFCAFRPSVAALDLIVCLRRLSSPPPAYPPSEPVDLRACLQRASMGGLVCVYCCMVLATDHAVQTYSPAGSTISASDALSLVNKSEIEDMWRLARMRLPDPPMTLRQYAMFDTTVVGQGLNICDKVVLIRYQRAQSLAVLAVAGRPSRRRSLRGPTLPPELFQYLWDNHLDIR